MEQILPYILSALTVYQLVLAGKKDKKAWVIGILIQPVWLCWMYLSQEWGFIPLNVAMWYVSITNYIKWNREDKNNEN